MFEEPVSLQVVDARSAVGVLTPGLGPTPDEIALVQRLNAETAGVVGNGMDDDVSAAEAVELYRSRLAAPDGDDLASRPAGLLLAMDLCEIDLESVDDYAVVEVVAAWARLTAWAQAGAARAAAELAERERRVVSRRPPEPQDSRPTRRRGPRCSAAHEIAMRLVIPRPVAQGMIDVGEALAGPLSPVGDALDEGILDLTRARAFVEGLAHVALPVALEVQDAVLPTAGRRTARQVRADIAAALIHTDPAEAVVRHRHARDRRRVEHPVVLPDGMAGVWAVLPASDAVALDVALDAAARTARNGGDTRTSDQLRADILAGVGHAALAHGCVGSVPGGDCASGCASASARGARHDRGFRLGSLGGRPAQIKVVVPLGDLLPEPAAATPTAPDQAGDSGSAAGSGRSVPGRAWPVAELEGYGAITPDVARALALGGVWTRLVTDPLSGAVRDVGRTRYHPPSDLADLVRARDRTCVAPGCSVPATSCDLDHTVPYHLGGSTADRNLAALCTSDHALKSADGVTVRQVGPGVFDFHLPSGHTYRRQADGTSTLRPIADRDLRAETGRTVAGGAETGRTVAAPVRGQAGHAEVGPPPF